MILYCVIPPRGESEAEGLDITEWFPSKVAALRQFNQVVREVEQIQKEWQAQLESAMPDYSSPFRSTRVTLERVEIADLPKKTLALALLNRRHYVVSRTTLKSTD